MKAIIYTRHSPQRNGKESESCEVQAAYCEELAAKKKWKVGGIYEDREKSGSDENRPGMWAAINQLEKGDVLLVWKLDRLARNVYLMECARKTVKVCKARIVAVQGDVEGDSAEAVMIRQILSSVMEYERKIIALRTKFAMLHYQRNGRRMSSRPPYGYCYEGDSMVEIEDEQKAVRYIMQQHGDKHPTLEIVQAMNKSFYDTRTGRKWVRRDVERIISNFK